jgi:hypothetical protein
MIPTSAMVPTVTVSSGLGTLLGPAALLGLAAVLVALGVLLVRLVGDVEPRPAADAALPQGASRVLPLLRRAA